MIYLSHAESAESAVELRSLLLTLLTLRETFRCSFQVQTPTEDTETTVKSG